MNSNKIFEEIKKPLRNGKLLLLIGVPITIIAPFILTRESISFLSFKNTGPIGDTIGGITAPIINIVGAFLVFLALKAQTIANILVQNQIDDQNKDKKNEVESIQLNKLYENFKSSIDNFTYTTLQPDEFQSNENVMLHGSEAFYQLFQDFFCDGHITEDSMKNNPKISEIVSILEICDIILKRVMESEVADKEVLYILTLHQFIYRIFPRLSSEYPDNLELKFCDSCEKDHGFPKKITELIKSIKEKCEDQIC